MVWLRHHVALIARSRALLITSFQPPLHQTFSPCERVVSGDETKAEIHLCQEVKGKTGWSTLNSLLNTSSSIGRHTFTSSHPVMNLCTAMNLQVIVHESCFSTSLHTNLLLAAEIECSWMHHFNTECTLCSPWLVHESLKKFGTFSTYRSLHHILLSLCSECRTVMCQESNTKVFVTSTLREGKKTCHSLALTLTLTLTPSPNRLATKPLLMTVVQYTIFNAPTNVTIQYYTT